MEYHVYWLLKKSCLKFFKLENTIFFPAKMLMKKWYLLITEKFLFWTVHCWEIRSFFEPKSWWKDDIYWLLKSSCFVIFGDGQYGLFISQNVYGKMIFTWSFWVFHDILGLGKYDFLCSAVYDSKKDLYRLQTLLDQGKLKHFWDHWHIKEIKAVLILILKELHASQVPNWFLLWCFFHYIVSCAKESFLFNCGF